MISVIGAGHNGLTAAGYLGAAGRFSSSDYDSIRSFEAMLSEIGTVVRNQWLREPPSLRGGFMDLMGMLKAGRDMRGLSMERRHRLLQMFTSSSADIINRWFESPMDFEKALPTTSSITWPASCRTSSR